LWEGAEARRDSGKKFRAVPCDGRRCPYLGAPVGMRWNRPGLPGGARPGRARRRPLRAAYAPGRLSGFHWCVQASAVAHNGSHCPLSPP